MFLKPRSACDSYSFKQKAQKIHMPNGSSISFNIGSDTMGISFPLFVSLTYRTWGSIACFWSLKKDIKIMNMQNSKDAVNDFDIKF